MKRFLAALAVLLGACGLARADYIIIIYNLAPPKESSPPSGGAGGMIGGLPGGMGGGLPGGIGGLPGGIGGLPGGMSGGLFGGFNGGTASPPPQSYTPLLAVAVVEIKNLKGVPDFPGVVTVDHKWGRTHVLPTIPSEGITAL